MTRARALAWPIFVISVAMSVAGLLLLAQVPATTISENNESLLLSAAFSLVMIVFGLVGAAVAQRLPGNPIGWLFLAVAAVQGGYEFAYGYANFSLGVAQLPAAAYAAWVTQWSSPLTPFLLGLAFLLFPDGRLLSTRWRPAGWFCALAIIPVSATYALAPGPLPTFPSIRNPLGLDGASFLQNMPVDLAVGLSLVLGAVAMIARLRRSRGVERQQVKWFAWAAGLITALLLVAAGAETLAGDNLAAGDAQNTAHEIGGLVWALVLCGLPVAAGIAILKHRLYDIDVVINRTLVYGALSAILVASYLVSVLVFRLVLSPVTGESDLAVAGSTLAVAALFRPARARIQAAVDRRFYRRRYDAARTLEGFAAHLRDELDLETLAADLRRVVHYTMQPSQVTVWLREGQR